ncbi:hypothetical protein M8C21_031786 [Ambrosia artemisiifolia]|uniref:Terpene synthase metal-binding domain-containing protein n=1 Tax=Ambrosia artemisiifolia TaxID=4212 RepID=A0AAD5GNY3_AMBAR|nr:hypothetical protein M8C21_031786 [Ambrosia artemisiifolia]
MTDLPYFWALGVYFEPKYSNARMFLAKVFTVTVVIDDTYDAYGTYDELWSLACIDMIPKYMKPMYQALMGVYEEMEEILVKDGKEYQLSYAKESMKELIRNYMMEAKWAHEGYIPTTEEHLSVSYVSSGYIMLTTTFFVGMGDLVTQESFKWALSKPPLSLICSNVPMHVKMHVINLTQVLTIMYKGKDNYTEVGEELICHIKSLLIHGMSI